MIVHSIDGLLNAPVTIFLEFFMILENVNSQQYIIIGFSLKCNDFGLELKAIEKIPIKFWLSKSCMGKSSYRWNSLISACAFSFVYRWNDTLLQEYIDHTARPIELCINVIFCGFSVLFINITTRKCIRMSSN